MKSRFEGKSFYAKDSSGNRRSTYTNSRAIDFACFLANSTRSKLTGIFLENVVNEEMRELANASSKNDEVLCSQERSKITDDNILLFKEACEKCALTADIHRKRGVPIDEMIRESRFADLIVVDPEMSFRGKIENSPSGFVKDHPAHRS